MQQPVDQHNQAIPNIDEQMLIEKVHQAYSVAPKVFLPALLLSLLLAVGVWNHGQHAWIIVWLVVLASCYLIRAHGWRQYHLLPESQRNPDQWNVRMHWAAGVTGLIWGLAALLPNRDNNQVSFFVGFVLTGVSAGAVPGLSSLPRAAMAFVVGCIAPFTIHALLDAGMSSNLMALMSLLFMAVMVLTVRSTYIRIDQGIRLQLQLAQRDAQLTFNEQLRTAANESLLRTQSQLRTFIKYAPAAVAMFNSKLRYLDYSSRWLSDYGLEYQGSSDEALLGRSYFEVMPDITGMMKEAFAATLAGEVQSNDQYPFFCNNGMVRWFRWEMRPWYEDSGAMGGVVMYSEDITESKRTTDALFARERLLAKLGMQIPGVMFQGRWRRDAGFRLTYVSANSQAVCGHTAEELYQQPQLYLKLFAAPERLRLRNAAQQAVAKAGNIHLQLRVHTTDDSVRWVQISAVAERLADASIVWYGYVEDVTVRHQMALDLAKFGVWDNERDTAA